MAVTIDGSTGWTYADNIKHKYGTGDDLEIFHDGSNSYLSHNGAGDLFIDADGSQENINLRSKKNVNIYVEDKTELAIKCNESGAVELYYDAVKKFDTNSAGVKVHGICYFDDNNSARFGDGDDLRLWHDGTNSYITNSTGHINIQGKLTENSIICNPDGAVELYYNNSKKFETTSYGGLFGAESSSSAASPVRLSLGGTYHDTAGIDPKLSVWSNGTDHMGFGVSSNQLDVILTSDSYDFVVYGGGSGDTERFRVYGDSTGIYSAGNASIGCTAQPSATVHGALIQSNGFILTSKDGTGLSYHHQFFNDNGAVGQISTNGSATTYSTSSDYRLKENAVAISDGITRLKTLKPYRFNFKADASTTVDGFFAHEVTPVVPEAISGEKDAVMEDGSIDAQSIDQSKLVPLLTAALQEAITKIEILETEVAALEAG